jgi:hypothetical protein
VSRFEFMQDRKHHPVSLHNSVLPSFASSRADASLVVGALFLGMGSLLVGCY